MRKPIRFFSLLAALLLAGTAFASPTIPTDTVGEQQLAAYVDAVNADLSAVGAQEINSVFMCFPTVASLGVTAEDNAEVPENVELTFRMDDTGLTSLELRATDPDQFQVLAAACIHAAAPSVTDYATALKATASYAEKARSAPANSFEDTVSTLQGTSVRTYYAYYPNQYQDEVNWLQLTLIFPLSGQEATGVTVTPVPEAAATPEDEYEGISYLDDYSHFEIFTTPTPEPDSPAGEQ